jgi:8-oxo-dGTP pyrophosphatase MutT (NUDIX family)
MEGWRKDALHILRQMEFDGHVFNPEAEEDWNGNYKAQIEWEEEALHRADCILFWIPRDVKGSKLFGFPMPGFTTNDEWGFWKDSGKVVLGTPTGAEHVRYQQYYASKFGVPFEPNLTGALAAVLHKIGSGALRNEGECCVPLMIWKKPEFQAWYESQKMAGNRLDGARVAWTLQVPPPAFGLGPPKHLFGYSLHVNVHIGSEGRNKINEVVLFRTDVSAVLLWCGDEIVLVREYRSPVRNSKGYVYELAGGSTMKPGEDPRTVAAHEVEEETGLQVDASRFQEHDCRQLAATLSAHVAKLFSVKLTQEEMDRLRNDRGPHGVEADSERTYIEVVPVASILEHQLLDWSTLGMVLSILRPITFKAL